MSLPNIGLRLQEERWEGILCSGEKPIPAQCETALASCCFFRMVSKSLPAKGTRHFAA